MNIINSALLKFALLPSALYRKMGVNTKHLKVILNAKLIMDDRRPNTFQQIQRKKNNKPINFATLGTMLWSALMGFVFLSSFFFGKSYETKFTFYFSFYVTVLASILIADFTSVLIDIRDNFIILPKPVGDRTFVVSRLLHIFIHVCKLVVPMILPAIIYMIINISITSILPFLFITLMATLFTIFLINACYILILKLITPSKFQTIISYIQIAFAIVFYAGYQLVPRLMNQTALSKYELSEHGGIIFLPSYWFAGAWKELYDWNNTPQLWLCLALTIVVPVLTIWLVIKYFAPSFNRKLSMITGSTSEATTTGKNRRKNTSSFYSNMLSKLFTKKGVERISFSFAWKIMLRSRGFKMKVYPAIGYLIVIIVVMLVMQNKTPSFSDIVLQTKEGIFYTLIVIYFSNLILVAALGQITMYEKYQAAWIFFTTPITKPGKLISGSVKAAIAQFFFPIATVIFVLITILTGPVVIPNLLFGIANGLLIVAISSYIGVSRLPFSFPQQIDSRNTVRVFSVMILGFVLAFLHYLIYHIIIVVSILFVLSSTAAWYILDVLSNLSWQKIYNKYVEV